MSQMSQMQVAKGHRRRAFGIQQQFLTMPGSGEQFVLAVGLPCHDWPGPILRHTSLLVVAWTTRGVL